MLDLPNGLFSGKGCSRMDSLARHGNAVAFDLVNETCTSRAQKLLDRK
jgi:hypothetical protein